MFDKFLVALGRKHSRTDFAIRRGISIPNGTVYSFLEGEKPGWTLDSSHPNRLHDAFAHLTLSLEKAGITDFQPREAPEDVMTTLVIRTQSDTKLLQLDQTVKTFGECVRGDEVRLVG